MFQKLVVLLILIAFVLAGCSAGDQSDGDLESEAALGQEVYERLGCDGCHAESSAVEAPALTGVFGSEVQLEGGETVTADEEYIRESILAPQEKVVAGYQPIMPDYEGQVTDEELEALVEYVQSLSE